MRTIVSFSKYVFIIVLTVVSFSCSPEDGEDGKDGVNGIDGVDGIAGVQGATGQDGNANVVSVLFEGQTISNGDNVFDIPQLTQEIFDTGFVFAYVTVTGNNYWETLPLSLGQQIILEIDKIEVGKATLRATFTQSNLRLRFVLVASSESNSVNFKNYNEVMGYYNIKD